MVTRISGMSSGLDTEAIITALIDSEKLPITTLENKVAEEEQVLAQWNSLSQQLSELKLATQQLASYTVWNQKSVESADEDYLTGSASSTGATTGTYDIHVETLAKSHRLGSDSQASKTDALSITGDFSVGGETITVAADDSLEDIASSINTAAVNMDEDEKVKAYLIGTTLIIEREKTGDTDINIVDGTNNILQSGVGGLGFFTGTVAAPNATLKNELQTSEDMSATIDGVSITGTSNTDIDAISGVNLNFKKEMAVGVTETLTISNDTETIKTLIDDFIAQYNDTMEFVKTQSTVELTDGGDITAVGYLQGETLMARISTTLNSLASSTESNPNYMDQDFNNLYKLGIWFEGDDNTLAIVDQDKLDNALDNNFDAVENLFRSYGTDVGGSVNAGRGIMRQFDTFLDAQVDPADGSISNREQTISDYITRTNKEITAKYDYLETYEFDLWEHFAAMETAVGDINSQSSYLMSALGVG